ncbi:ABC transporter permease [Burkholderia cenocepacia]|uniref:ABC transporter permease n=1 Tax=Burkholderia cenocepacia TaxID=95486 RepID=UPI0019082B66|nr:ABC transporter permease [Burkholderia cenocepacia]MBJ9696809.1 ABC transporter permease [Burkholderia cenocepacia]
MRLLDRINPAAVLLIPLLGVMAVLSPLYQTPAGLMNFLQRAAALLILACGQSFVLISGGFDLSAGAVVTLTVIGSALIANGDPGGAWIAVVGAYGAGIVIGAINGFVVGRLKVPSIIATLGALLWVRGAAMVWSGGSPAGFLPENFRYLGRGVIRGVPLLQTLPVAVIVLIVFAALSFWLLHKTNFGRLLFMLGDNPTAAQLAGARVALVRCGAFMVSSTSAVTAGILFGGFSGVSVDVGTGCDLQAIAAAAIGGVVLLGGQGSVAGACLGASILYALFTVLNLLGFPEPLRVAVQGLILICAAALTSWRQRRGA